jgi:hypothetical protein
MAIGVSFLDDSLDETGAKPAPNRFQQAVEVLSMRLPKFPRGQVMAPAPLLQSQGGAGLSPSIMQAFQRMAGMPQQPQGGPMSHPGAPMLPPMQGPPQMAPQGPPPAPRIVPGIDQLGAPPPSGPVQQQWNPPTPPQMPGQLVGTATGELETAAKRAGRGYNPQPWGSLPQGFL